MAMTRTVLLAAAAAGALSLTGTGAFAADDGYQDVFSSVLTSVGLLSPDKPPPIDYRERAPLVLPPKMLLTKPVDAGATRTAAWPQDPDVLKRRKEAQEARAPHAGNLGNTRVTASRAELMAGRIDGDGGNSIPDSDVRRSSCGNQGNQKGCLVINPDELAAMDERYKASGQGEKQDLNPGDEPSRDFLTQPPKGYLRVNKVVKATTEAPHQRVDSSNAKPIFENKPDPDE